MNVFCRCLILLGAILYLPVDCFSQETPANTMLWRISGNQLSKPSYLFGTMHLMDRRLFQFGDSVYAGIRNTEGFAGELDLEQMSNMIVDAILAGEEGGASVLLKDLMSPEQKKKYAAPLARKFRKKFELITYNELKKQSENWLYSNRKPDDMSTFMDAWLFDMARTQGKWVGGLEDYADQMDLGRSDIVSQVEQVLLPESARVAELERFINIYAKGGLSQLNTVIQETSGNLGAYQINHRNIKMARRIDSLSAIRTGFYAVGAAHLPGDSGLISLLRQKGYSVTPVFSSAPVDPDHYLQNSRRPEWVSFHDLDSSYTVRMPGQPVRLTKWAQFRDARLYFDFFTMSAYFNVNMHLPGVSEKQLDSISAGLGKVYAEKGRVLADSNLAIGNRQARYFHIEMPEATGHLITLGMPGRMIMNMVFSLSKNGAEKQDAEKFLSSLQVIKTSKEETSRGWRTMSWAPGLISFETPVELTREESYADSIWKQTSFSGLDLLTQTYYLARIYEARPGYFSNLDSTYFDNVIGQSVTNANAKLLEQRYFRIEGFPAARARLGMKVDKDSIHSEFVVLNRGNRRYLFITSYAPRREGSADADRFLEKLRLFPYEAPPALPTRLDGANFSTVAPAPFGYDQGEYPNGIRKFMMYDSVSRISAHVEIEPLNRYYRTESDSSLLREQVQLYVAAGDSLLSYTTSVSNGRLVADALIRYGESHNLKRVRLFANGDSVYAIYAFLPDEVLRTKTYTDLFGHFRVLTPALTHTYTKSKARYILSDLLIPDSLIFTEATQALEAAAFTREDLPLLQEALLHPYADFSPNSYCTHDRLIQLVIDQGDPSTIDFVSRNYPLLQAKDSELQYPFLSILTRTHTRESYLLLKELLASGLPAKGYANMLFPSITDSVELTKLLLPDLLQYSGDSLLLRLLPPVLYTLYNRQAITLDDLGPLRPAMIRLGQYYREQMENNPGYYPSQFNRFCALLGIYRDGPSLALLRYYAKRENIDVVNGAAIGMLENDLLPDEATRLKLAKDDYYRMHFYAALQEKNLSASFPAAYARQPALAASHLYNAAGEDYTIRNITYLSEQKHKTGAETQRYFLYRVRVENEGKEVELLGVAGPYSLKDKVSNTIGDFTGLFTGELLDEKELGRQFRSYLSQFQQ